MRGKTRAGNINILKWLIKWPKQVIVRIFLSLEFITGLQGSEGGMPLNNFSLWDNYDARSTARHGGHASGSLFQKHQGGVSRQKGVETVLIREWCFRIMPSAVSIQHSARNRNTPHKLIADS
jgi:hypothetical protein